MAEGNKYLYGPVPSRRLGRSLGVDIVPCKVCTLDCVYCQLGGTSQKTVERKEYVPVEHVLAECRKKLNQGLEADFVTVSGSGEPTLNSRLGELIEGIKKITQIPVAVLTNGTLLSREDVRENCARADVVLPSLDAADEQTFQKINRPHKDISIEKQIAGLSAFGSEFPGRIWLEVFLVEGLNTGTEQITKIRDAIEQIRVDKIHLNTAVRPTAQPDIRRLDASKMQAIAKLLGPKAEVVADLSAERKGIAPTIREPEPGCQAAGHTAEDVLSMLKRRPCSLKELCSSLSILPNEALKYIAHLQQQGVVDSSEKNGITFFKAN
jgi:wyosine [tRNA(Phe)-imidazoG37] synthetase (radical SAM superfamily)